MFIKRNRKMRWPLFIVINGLMLTFAVSAGWCAAPSKLQNTCWNGTDGAARLCIKPNAIEIAAGQEPALTLRQDPQRHFSFAQTSGKAIRDFAPQVTKLYAAELDQSIPPAAQYATLLIHDKDRKIALVLVSDKLLFKLEESQAAPPGLDQFAPAAEK